MVNSIVDTPVNPSTSTDTAITGSTSEAPRPAATMEIYKPRGRGFDVGKRQEISEALNFLMDDPEMYANSEVRYQILRTQRYVDGDQYVTIDPITRRITPIRDRKAVAHSLNFIKSDGRKLCAVIKQHMPGVSVVPEDKESIDQIRIAKDTEIVLHDWFQKNEMPIQTTKVVNTFWRSGTVYTYIGVKRTNKMIHVDTLDFNPSQVSGAVTSAIPEHDFDFTTDDPRTGITIDDEIPEPLEFAANMPADTVVREAVAEQQDTSHAVFVPEHIVFPYSTDGLEVTVQPGCMGIADTPWLVFDKVYNLGELVEIYGDDIYFTLPNRSNSQKPDELPHVTPANWTTQSNDTDNYRRILTRVWFRPSQYNLMKEEHANYFINEFPEGVVIDILGNRVLRMSRGVIEEDWIEAKPDAFGPLTQPPLAAEIISAQIIYNDSINMGLKSLFSNVPRTLVGAQVMTEDDIKRMNGNPFSMLRVNNTALDITKQVVNTPTSHFPTDLLPFAMGVRETSREIDGILPQIFGGGPPVATYREATMRRDSAMSQIGLISQAVASWLKRVCEAAMKKMALYGFQNISIGRTIFRVHEQMQVDGWMIEVEAGIPVSDIEARDALNNILSMGNPELIQALSIFAPQNKSRLFDLMGIKGMRSIDQDTDSYCAEILKSLVNGKPQFQNGQMFAPVQPNPDLEDPATMIGYMRDWAMRVDAGLAIKKRNPAGYANVLLYISEYKAYQQEQEMMAQQQQQMIAAGPQDTPSGPPGPNGQTGTTGTAAGVPEGPVGLPGTPPPDNSPVDGGGSGMVQ